MAKKNRYKNRKRKLVNKQKKTDSSFNWVEKIGELFKRKEIVFLKKIILFFLVVLAFSFVVFNLYYSQNITPVYSKFSQEDRSSAVELAQSLRGTKDFDEVHTMLVNIYGKDFDNDLFKNEREQNSKINSLMKFLEVNPKSRDILFALYKLYNEKGNAEKADYYFKRVKEIDPGINF